MPKSNAMMLMRTALHVIITLAVVIHGAWMAMMPLAHAVEPSINVSTQTALAPSAQGHNHTGLSHHAAGQEAQHGGHHAHGGAHPANAACADGADHGSDHNMAGCDCTLCKPVSLAAADIKPGLNRPVLRDQAVRLDPAQQPRSTTGPPVGLRAPPTLI